jgi:hypothetical protein
MKEDEILSFDYRSPYKKSDFEDFEEWYSSLPKRNNNYSDYFSGEKPVVKKDLPAWCEVGTKISGYKTRGKNSMKWNPSFGIVDNIFRENKKVNIKWSDGKTIEYDIGYLNNLIEQETIEILYERK